MLENYEFDLAFSFAGEDRKIVEKIYKKLKKKNISVFYDMEYQSQLSGEDLYSGLRNLYKNKGKYVVCFISENYTKKIWTNLEFSAIKERLMSTFFSKGFLIPIIIGDAKLIEDIPSYIGYYTHTSISKTAELLVDKINFDPTLDTLIQNVDNFINFFCTKVVCKIMDLGYTAKTTSENEISFEKNGKIYSYIFSSDSENQLPCILVNKKDNSVYELEIASPPNYLITWEQCNYLLFTVQNFDDLRKEYIYI